MKPPTPGGFKPPGQKGGRRRRSRKMRGGWF